MEISIQTKSEAVASTQEAKVKVDIEQPEQDGAGQREPVLEVCLSNPSVVLVVVLWADPLQAVHWARRGRRLPVYRARRMGDCCHHLPVLSLERWPIFNGLWGHPCRLWRHCHFAITCRNGLDVRFLPCQLFY